ncbi:hypothetical protein ACFYRN_01975 [Streptomyces sp. NPDC005227]|uniref:hypothetical protein n=1 Tax=Streptomyces sp. NPDC005227 TaxID=3364707 RepID=UPI00367C646B
MRISRPESPGHPAAPAHPGHVGHPRHARRAARTGCRGSGGSPERAEAPERTAGWTKAVRGPWVVLCTVATVVLGPAAVTASALDRANAAPPRHTVRVEQPRAYLAADLARRRTTA